MTFAEDLAVKLIRGTVARGLIHHQDSPRVAKDVLYALDTICLSEDEVLVRAVEEWYNGLPELEQRIAAALFTAGGVVSHRLLP